MATEGKEKEFVCENCGAVNPTVVADHVYSLVYDSVQGKYMKETGEVNYSCYTCTQEIRPPGFVLISVDEL